MQNRRAKKRTYLEEYNARIAPRLKELDIFLKERETPVTLWQASQLLDMPYEEVKRILSILEIDGLNHKNFFTLLLAGTSKVCGVVRRETERGFPEYYTPQEVSYIYELNAEKTKSAFKALGLAKVKSECLPLVFENLTVD